MWQSPCSSSRLAGQEDRCIYLVNGSTPDQNYSATAHEGPLLTGVQIFCDDGPETKLNVLADVTVDETFIARTGLHWKTEVLQILRTANQILDP